MMSTISWLIVPTGRGTIAAGFSAAVVGAGTAADGVWARGTAHTSTERAATTSRVLVRMARQSSSTASDGKLTRTPGGVMRILSVSVAVIVLAGAATAQAPAPQPHANLAQLMRGIFFP